MLIGIDGNEANVQNRVGVNVFAYELLWGLNKLAKNTGPEKETSAKKQHPIEFEIFLKNPPLHDMPKEGMNWKYRVLKGGKIWILTKLTPYLFFASYKPDIFYTPSHYLPLFLPMPAACSIMDLGYLKFSGQFKKKDFWQLKYWSANSISVAKAVHAISCATQKDIVRHYPSASEKTFVSYLAYDRQKFNRDIKDTDVRRVKEKYTIVGDYILFLSTLKPSKNVEGLLNAFFQLTDKHPSIQLVITGKKGWSYEPIFEKVKKLGLDKRVVFTDFIPEEDKPPLMAGAKLLVLPSFWEGFGLDVLNAFACGVPVVVSKVGSLPEVAGDAAVLVDPYDPASIADGIDTILSASEVKYNEFIQKGYKQADKFSWEKTANEILSRLISIKN